MILQAATPHANPQQEEASNAHTSGAIPFTTPGGTATVPNAVLGEGETLYWNFLSEAISVEESKTG